MRTRVLLALVVGSCGGEGLPDIPSADAAGSTDGDGDAAGGDAVRDPDLGAGVPDLGPVSFAAQIQPIFDDTCVDSTCHDSVSPARGLELTWASGSVSEMVGVASSQCPSASLVEAGQPDSSYLVWKLEGAGPCFLGRRMPRNAAALSDGHIALIRAWITQGAEDN